MNRENGSVSKHEREPSGHVLTRLPLSSALLCSGVNFAAKLRLTLDAPDFFYLKEEDRRIPSEGFQRTPEFASNRNTGRTKLEA